MHKKKLNNVKNFVLRTCAGDEYENRQSDRQTVVGQTNRQTDSSQTGGGSLAGGWWSVTL